MNKLFTSIFCGNTVKESEDLSMRVGLVQYDICWEDKKHNKDRLLSLLDKIGASSVDWLIFPEMTLTGFSMDIKRTLLDPSDVDFFKNISKRFNSYVTFGGVFEKNNRAVTLDPRGNIVSQYSKIHLFGYGDESDHYDPGDTNTLFNVGDLKVFPSVCYDLRFSYLFWDQAKNSDVFFVIASWPKERREHWKTLLRARAIDNQCYVIGVNRIGADKKLEYSGDSCIYDPFGEQVLDCGDKEGVFYTEISKDRVASIRKQYPFLRDRKR